MTRLGLKLAATIATMKRVGLMVCRPPRFRLYPSWLPLCLGWREGFGLAAKLVGEVFATIARLKATKVTMLLVEQFAAAALDVADFGYVLENGRISSAGPAESLKNDPAVHRKPAFKRVNHETKFSEGFSAAC